MKIKGRKTTEEYVEVETSPRDVYETLKKYIFEKLELEPGVYLSNDGKAKIAEEFDTSHYSCYTKEVDVTAEQLHALKTLEDLVELL